MADVAPPDLTPEQPPLSTNTPQVATDAEDARLKLRKELAPLKMTKDEMGELWSAIGRARSRMKKLEDGWKTLLKEYLPSVKASGDAETLKVNVHFRNVHTKIGQLFYRTPEIACFPRGPMLDKVPDPITGQPVSEAEVAAIKQAVLNWFLGPDNINASRLMDECLFDVLAWSGIGCIKLGYRATMVPIQEPVMVPDPRFMAPQPNGPLGLAPIAQPPMVPQTGPDGKPVTQTKLVSIHEDWYARHFSPLKALFNDDLRSTRFDEEATWVGWDWVLPKELAKREFALSDDEAKLVVEDERVFKHTDVEAMSGKKSLVKGVELWRKASLFRGNEQPHPQAIDHIVVIDGLKDYPVVYRPSPDQTFDEQGRLTHDSMIGFPIHFITIRDLADSPFPPSDSAFTNSQAKEMNTHRRLSVKIRDASVPKVLYDAGHFEDAEIDSLKNGEPGIYVPVKPGALAAAGGSAGIASPVVQVTSTVDDWRTAEMLKTDMQETLGIAGPQAGTPAETVRSATELAQVATSFAGRMEKEQRRAVDCFIGLARKVDALIMRYATDTQYVSIAGSDGARDLKAWNNRMISGRYSYEILPDSSWRLDAAQYLRVVLSGYNLSARDPLFKRAPILRLIWQLLGVDPREAVFTDEEIAQMQHAQQPEHGGPANQHEQSRTGNRQNSPQAGNTPSRRLA